MNWLRLTVLTMLLMAVAAFAEAPSLPTIPSPALEQLYLKATRTYMGYGMDEFSMTLDANGNARPISTSHEVAKDHVWVFSGDIAIVHTHPRDCDPRPSPGDSKTAKQFGIPNFVLSQFALWAALPDGKTIVKVGNVTFKHGHIVVQ